MTNWKKSQYYMPDREIVEYYCQLWDNVKHMKNYIVALRNKYKNEIGFNKRKETE